MQYSPKLKRIAERFKEILAEEDIAAIIVMHTPGFSEYLFHLTPTYSCVEYKGQGKVGFNISASHYANDKHKRDEVVANTSNMLRLLGDVGGPLVLNAMDLSRTLDNYVKAEHNFGGHTSQDQQNS